MGTTKDTLCMKKTLFYTAMFYMIYMSIITIPVIYGLYERNEDLQELIVKTRQYYGEFEESRTLQNLQQFNTDWSSQHRPTVLATNLFVRDFIGHVNTFLSKVDPDEVAVVIQETREEIKNITARVKTFLERNTISLNLPL